MLLSPRLGSGILFRSNSTPILFCGFPLAADGRYDGSFLLEFGESLVNFFAVSAEGFGHITGGNGLTRFAHGLEYLFFHNLDIKN